VTPFSLASRVMVLVCMAVLAMAGIAGWFLRDQVFQTFQDPGEPFQTYSPPEAADYNVAEGWYAQGAFEDGNTDEAAIFFVHPTTYSGGSNWNAPLDKLSASEAVILSSLPNYAAPFEFSGQVFAPRYRQAALYAFMNNREDGVQARQFAYKDVERAFDQFLIDIGDERPIMMVGIGQGGLHALGLLINRVAINEDVRARLIAAYLIETPVPLDLLTTSLLEIPACETPEDIRCIVSYSPALPDEERRIRILTERTMSWMPEGRLGFVEGRGLLCVNPILSARSREYASPRQHRGGVAAEGLPHDTLSAPIVGQTGAQCVDGILMTERPRSTVLRRPSRLAEDYREPPFNLFYEDLRFDASVRTSNLTQILNEERRWAPGLEAPEAVEEAPVVPIPDRSRFPY